MKRVIVLLSIVVISMMTETADAARQRREGRSREILGGLVRVSYNRRPAYRPRPIYQSRRYHRYPQNNVVHDAKTDITTSERPTFWGKSPLGEENLQISRQARQSPPPTTQELAQQVEKIKIMWAEKQERAFQEKVMKLEAELRIAKLEKELAEAKK